MTLCLFYSSHLLLCKPLKRINSPLLMGLVKGLLLALPFLVISSSQRERSFFFFRSMSNQLSVKTAASLVNIPGQIRGKTNMEIHLAHNSTL